MKYIDTSAFVKYYGKIGIESNLTLEDFNESLKHANKLNLKNR